jgi:GNAT superfamily N-acetyltransferase
LSETLTLIDLQERPGLWSAVNDQPNVAWPEFMMHDQVAEKLWHPFLQRFPRYSFALMTAEGAMAASSCAIPIPWDGDPGSLPAGWDGALELGMASSDEVSRSGMALCALGVTVLPAFQKHGCGRRLLIAMKERAQAEGYRALISPMRPTHKHLRPELSMEEYIGLKDEQGRVTDPWLRTHLSLGAKVLKVCPESMRIEGSVEEWEAWAGVKFEQGGPEER